MRRHWVLVSALAALALPAAAHAAEPLGLTCADQGDGIRLCQGKVRTFDGVPVDANLALPAGQRLPLVVLSHGWGGSKLGYDDLKPWAQRGYAALAFSARGFGESCGSAASRLADAAGCAQGWVHLDDARYEARDVQQLAGLLADQGSRSCVTARCCPTARSCRGPRRKAGRCASLAPCPGSRGATSSTR
jgi:pimeloyl-ACP methyl ester carboxylesterase